MLGAFSCGWRIAGRDPTGSPAHRQSAFDKDAKEARNKRIFDLWMRCYTQVEIADVVGTSQSEIDRRFTQNGNIAEYGKTDKKSQAASDQLDCSRSIGLQQTNTFFLYCNEVISQHDRREFLLAQEHPSKVLWSTSNGYLPASIW